jgi:hypothetical protein
VEEEMMDYAIASLCFFASLMQAVTIRLPMQDLARAAKRIATVGFFLAGVKYVYAGVMHFDLATSAITAIPLVLLSIASIMNGWALLEANPENRKNKCSN